jgi:hypothetical protein
VEVVVCIFIVGLLFVASLTAVNSSRAAQISLADRSRGHQLAADLMSEILAMSYTDPYWKSGMGPGADEVATGDRSLFDDVDDYLNWSASPPQQRDGTTISGFAGWTRSVDVDWIDPANPALAASSANGAKRITVTIQQRNGRVVALITTVRTEAYTSLISGEGL